MITPAMPDPARTARSAVRVVESMGVPSDISADLAALVLADVIRTIARNSGADMTWLHEVAAALANFSASYRSGPVRSSGEPPEHLISAMDSLGYTWSVELGRFTGGRDDAA